MVTTDSDRDVLVVGAGVAGICCAGELLLEGFRPTLICETKEVAYNLRSEWIGGNQFTLQSGLISVPVGGWWLQLARRLQAPIGSMTAQMPFSLSILGDPAVAHLRQWYLSAHSLMEMIDALAPFPLGEHRDEVERVLARMTAIPFEDLSELDKVLWTEWVENETTNEFARVFLNQLGAFVAVIPTKLLSHLTAFGVIAYLRGWFMGEAYYPDCYPDYREGVFIPIARAIEEQGGTVLRGAKVDRVLVREGKVEGVRLRDGTELRAPAVAIATGNPRIPSLFDEPPREIEQLAAYEWGEENYMGYYSVSLLDRQVLPDDFQSFHCVLDPANECFYAYWPNHVRTPWGVEAGKQVLVAVTWLPKGKVEELGGKDAVFERLDEVADDYFPGWRKAVEEHKTLERGGMWFSQIMAGDKLQRQSPSVEGLWYVGDGSVPIKGIWTEAAASAGILGARAIAEEHGANGHGSR